MSGCTLTEYRLACAEHDELYDMVHAIDKVLDTSYVDLGVELQAELENVLNTLVNLRQAAAMRLHDASLALRDAS